MWETIETAFYILMLLLLISTFMPKPIRRNVADSTYHLWRFLIELVRWLEPRAYRLVTGLDPSRRAAIGRPMPDDDYSVEPRPTALRHASPALANRTQAFAETHDEIPRSDALEHKREPVRSVRDAGDLLTLTRDEIAAVARMIAHNKAAAKPTKSSTIQAGFGVSRGGGATYLRASAIYDQIFAAPNEAMYPTLTAEREKISAP